MLKATIFVLSLFSFFHTSGDYRLYDTTQEKFISLHELTSSLSSHHRIVFGEQHYQEDIQKSQAYLINRITSDLRAKEDFSIAWEFLNYTHHKEIQKSLNQYIHHKISAIELFSSWFPASRSPEKNLTYLPVVEKIIDLNGELIAPNAPRSQKRVITTQGISSLDPKLIPPNYERGSQHYFERFKKAMQGHVTGDQLERYFQAQSFTDSVIAHQLQKGAKHSLRFLIIGSFHTDYQDGVIRELKKVSSDPLASIKLVDAKDLTFKDKQALMEPHKDYGPIADYVYFINWNNHE